MLTELPPEIIGENPVVPPMDLVEPIAPAVPPAPSAVSPEQIQGLAETFVKQVVSALEPEYQNKVSAKDKELEDGRIGFDEELSKRDEDRKNLENEHKTKLKDIETKHKDNLKVKDKEVSDLKKQLKDKDKEIKKLLDQVKDALNEED